MTAVTGFWLGFTEVHSGAALWDPMMGQARPRGAPVRLRSDERMAEMLAALRAAVSRGAAGAELERVFTEHEARADLERRAEWRAMERFHAATVLGQGVAFFGSLSWLAAVAALAFGGYDGVALALALANLPAILVSRVALDRLRARHADEC